MTRPDVYCLTDSNNNVLSPAIQATALAKYSRSPESARKILETINQESANSFQEKWVVGYGHNSVAGLANVPICYEGVSIVASKFIESFPCGNYSEKSTRYQKFSSDSFVVPLNCPETMKNFAMKFYEAYDNLMPRMIDLCSKKMDEDSKKQIVKARAFDNLRYLLPAGTGTNLAAVLNMRDARDLVSSLKGHRNSEFKYLGELTEEALSKICPVLLRHTEPNEFTLNPIHLGDINPNFNLSIPSWCVDLYKPDPNEDINLTQIRFENKIADYYHMSWESFSKFMEARSPHQNVPEIFKSITISFDILMDYGAYRDLQRHRRCVQFSEPLGTSYGYLIPDDILDSELEYEYRFAMDSIQAYGDEDVIHNPDYYQYMIPMGYLHRSIFQMDLAEVYYISELRTKPQGHPSYRRVAYEMFKVANKRYPRLLKWCRALNPEIVETGTHS